MIITSQLIGEGIISLVGIFVGMVAALALDRFTERQRKRQRSKIILRALAQELSDNYKVLQDVKPAYQNTPWGRSFYISTIGWETALSSGDLPDIIGFELADLIATQYALLVRLRYYVDLLTRLWFAPQTIQGYEDIRRGLHKTIVDTSTQALSRHAAVLEGINHGKVNWQSGR
jgi:hypothetical protein